MANSVVGRTFVSGRQPKPYTVENGSFSAVNGPQTYNRSLYGAIMEECGRRFRVLAGDRPEWMLDVSGDGGRVFLGVAVPGTEAGAGVGVGAGVRVGVGSGEGPEVEAGSGARLEVGVGVVGVVGSGIRWLSACEEVRAAYDGVEMSYAVRDPALGGGLLFVSSLPLAREPGFVIRLESEGIPPGVRIAVAYGGASGARDARGYDPGYTREEKTAFRAESCRGNRFAVDPGVGRFVCSADGMGERAVCGEATMRDAAFTVSDPYTLGLVGGGLGDQTPEGDAGAAGEGAWGADGGRLRAEDAPMVVATAEAARMRKEEFLVFRCVSAPSLRRLRRAGRSRVRREAARLYGEAAAHYRAVAGRVAVRTPEPLFGAAARTAGAALEAIWIPPVFVHGAWSWDLPIMGWRSLYGPVAFGWHDRVRAEALFFAGLQLDERMRPAGGDAALSAMPRVSLEGYYDRETAVGVVPDLAPAGGPAGVPEPDPDYALARQSSRSVFVSPGMMPFMPGIGYKAMYNMQEVFVDQWFYALDWSGDAALAAALLPAVDRHLEWERRCFDRDDDGLYENYANYWSSDAVFASGAGCALASAYNFRANRAAAKWAARLGRDPAPYERRAEAIRQAVYAKLWMPDKGRIAEMIDTHGAGLLHPDAGLPTIVHVAESGLLDPFDLYRMLQHAKTGLERMPVEGCPGELVWNTNWAPYVWSVREIDYADVLHAALAFYLAGCIDDGYKLLIGALRDSTCNHLSPGGFMCTFEGSCVDFADTSSMFGRALVEGLFGIRPDFGAGRCVIAPGFPRDWREASVRTPDLAYAYRFDGGVERFEVELGRKAELELRTIARSARVHRARCNGEEVPFDIEPGIGHGYVVVRCAAADPVVLEVEYGCCEAVTLAVPEAVAVGERVSLGGPDPGGGPGMRIAELRDPQGLFRSVSIDSHGAFEAVVAGNGGGPRHATAFLKCVDHDLEWWQPFEAEVREPVDFAHTRWDGDAGEWQTTIRNNAPEPVSLVVSYGEGTGRQHRHVGLSVRQSADLRFLPADSARLSPGTNRMDVCVSGDREFAAAPAFADWSLPFRQTAVPLPIDKWFNGRAGTLFQQSFVSPRTPHCSLQVPLHLVPSDWCVTRVEGLEFVNDNRLRSRVDERGILTTEWGVEFRQTADPSVPNVLYVSRWDNFPTACEIEFGHEPPVRGEKLYFLLTGYTNQMQCGVTNGAIDIGYADGTVATLELTAPDRFRSMEKGPQSERAYDLHCYRGTFVPRVKIGDIRDTEEGRTFLDSLAASSGGKPAMVDAIYAQLTDALLEPKDIRSVTVRAVANDVIIGLLGMSIL